MDEKTLKERHQYILALLQQERLKDAIKELETTFWDHPRDELNSIKTPYQYMLQYLLEGMQDPERYQLYRKLIQDTLAYTDRCFHAELDKISNNIYHSKRREELPRLRNISYGSLLTQLEAFSDELAISKLVEDKSKLKMSFARHEKALSDLFLKTWLADSWSAGERDEALRFLESKLLIESDLCLLVSAVSLSLLELFDPAKFTWLIEAYKKGGLYASARALVGLVMIIHMQNQRLSFYPNLNAQISFLVEDQKTANYIHTIYLQFLQSQETEKIDKRMREEIIPEMIKNASSMKDMKFGFEEGEGEDNDHNPDWQDALENSPLGDKIREINELQLQGADVYMSSFATLKGYPFFYSIQNWFYPFEKRHSAVYYEFGHDTNKGSIVDLILNSGLFCDSDKYSLCFTFLHIPKSQRDMMLSQLTEQQMGGLDEEQKAMKLQELSAKPDIISNQYIHDLYRFFRLYRFKQDFKDIFRTTLKLHNLPQFKYMAQNTHYLSQLADFFLKNEHYERAIEVYKQMMLSKELSFELFQKKGYCHQKLGQYEEAIQSYIKADTIKSDNLWTNRHLATCYRISKQYDKALYYYEAVEKVQPNRLSNLFYLGMCHTALGAYDTALQYFFKMDYIKGDNKRTWRAIAWCSFICGKHEQAKKYYQKILASKPVAIDYLNAGHVEWALGELQEAVNYYKLAIQALDSKDEFIELFQKDQAYLIKQGIPEQDIPLVIDLLD